MRPLALEAVFRLPRPNIYWREMYAPKWNGEDVPAIGKVVLVLVAVAFVMYLVL